jgi:negative regulator of flagellin synthesis FlgM
MNIEITTQKIGPASNAGREKVASPSDQATAAAAKPAGAAAGVKLSLTGMASKLEKITQRLKEQPDVDDARVARIRQAIDNGSYELNTQRIAEKLLSAESMMGGR